jgi:hypothetical protein
MAPEEELTRLFWGLFLAENVNRPTFFSNSPPCPS